MLTNYARWYSFTPPQWPTLSPPLTLGFGLAFYSYTNTRREYQFRLAIDNKTARLSPLTN